MEKYSVLMAVYYKDKPEYLELAIESMLSQTLPPDELVLVCDGKLTPELDSLIDSYSERLKDFFNVVRLSENCGLGVALDKGLAACRNEIIVRMDSDDISEEHRVEKQMKVFLENGDISVVGGQIAEFSGEITNILGYRRVPLTHQEILKRAASRNPMNHVTTLFRKSDVLTAGSYRDLPGFEDYYLWVRMLSQGKVFKNIDDVCCYVRVNEGTYSRRGGMEYYRHTMRMEKYLLEYGILNKFQYIKNLIVRFLGVVVVPNKVRSFLFKKLMRKHS